MARVPAHVRALVRQLRPGRTVRQVVDAVAALGHRVSQATVGRVVGPPAPRAEARTSRALPPAAKLARAALAALDAARAELAGVAPT